MEEISRRPRHGHPASLKDLCAEDKKRVANLIKELAKYVSVCHVNIGLCLILKVFYIL